MKKNPHTGSSLESFLEEEGLLEQATAVAIKRVIAFMLEKEMKKQKLTKMKLATKMKTSRAALDRLLDPNNTSVSLKTLVNASHVLGKEMQIRFV